MGRPGELTSWVRPLPPRRRLLLDVGTGLLAVAVCVLGLELTRAAGGATPPGVLERTGAVVGTALVALPLCVRRLVPVPAMLVSVAAFITLGSLDPRSAATFTLNLALFLVLLSGTAWARDRRRAALAWVVVLVAMVAWYLASLVGLVSQGLPPASAGVVGLTALVNVLYFSGALLGGRALWRAARDRDTLRRTADALRVEQEATARAAVVAERLRIARELHDVVAHHVSTSGVQAAAARRVLERTGEADEPGTAEGRTRAAAALRQVEASSRAAVGEMHGLLGLLRAPDDPPDPDDAASPRAAGGASRRAGLRHPGLEDLPGLVEEARGRGTDVGLAVVGEPFALPSTTATSAVRLVQEALVNVERHSAAGAARVVLRWLAGSAAAGGDGAVEVEVVDDGPARSGTGGTGLGHRGMRERAALVGGEVETGPRPGGGYRVRGRYPVPDGRSAGPRPAGPRPGDGRGGDAAPAGAAPTEVAS